VLRRNALINRVVMFDPFIETAPPDTPAGIYDQQVVYSDGTMQQYHPTIPYPDVFVVVALKFPGVESVVYNVDGTFNVDYLGTPLRVRATGEVNRTALRAGERVVPVIMPAAQGRYSYQLQENLERLTVWFMLEPR